METKALSNFKVESPNFSLTTLKIEPKEEDDSQLDEKCTNLYDNYDRKCPLKSETIEEEEIHIKHEDEENKLNKKIVDKEFGNAEMIVAEPSDTTKEINKKNESVEGLLNYNVEESRDDEFYESAPLQVSGDKKGKLDKKGAAIFKSEPNECNGRSHKHKDRQCPECPYRNPYKSNLEKHLITKHKKTGKIDLYICQECPYETHRKWHLKSHAETHNNLMLKCSKCSYETSRATNLKKHERKHTPESQWLHCPECPFVTHLQSCFRKHSLIHKSSAIKCPDCPYQTGRKDLFAIHQVKHESVDKWYPCPLCPYKSYNKSTLIAHSLRRHGCNPNNPKQVEIFKCSKCSYESGYKISLERHQLGHDPSNWLQCPECAYKTPCKNVFKKHQMRHQGENAKGWHRCLECTYKTPHKYVLRKHVITHKSADESRQFECLQCSFKTAYKNHLKQHQLTHKEAHEVEWFYCYNCSYKTKRKPHLVRHNISIHKRRIER